MLQHKGKRPSAQPVNCQLHASQDDVESGKRPSVQLHHPNGMMA
jgi:hypothetical protein